MTQRPELKVLVAPTEDETPFERLERLGEEFVKRSEVGSVRPSSSLTETRRLNPESHRSSIPRFHRQSLPGLAMLMCSDGAAATSPHGGTSSRFPSVPRYRVVLENGDPAEPPVWYTPEAAWQVGDWIIARGHQYEVMAVEAGDAETHAVLVVKSRPLPGT